VAQDKANFFFILEDQANAIPNHILLYYQGQEWTYHQVRLIAQRFGNYFLSLGLNSGGTVPIIQNIDHKKLITRSCSDGLHK